MFTAAYFFKSSSNNIYLIPYFIDGRGDPENTALFFWNMHQEILKDIDNMAQLKRMDKLNLKFYNSNSKENNLSTLKHHDYNNIDYHYKLDNQGLLTAYHKKISKGKNISFETTHSDMKNMLSNKSFSDTYFNIKDMVCEKITLPNGEVKFKLTIPMPDDVKFEKFFSGHYAEFINDYGEYTVRQENNNLMLYPISDNALKFFPGLPTYLTIDSILQAIEISQKQLEDIEYEFYSNQSIRRDCRKAVYNDDLAYYKNKLIAWKNELDRIMKKE